MDSRSQNKVGTKNGGSPGNANLPIGVPQNANREIGVPRKHTITRKMEINNIRFTQRGTRCIRVQIRAVEMGKLGASFAGLWNDSGIASEAHFAIVLYGG